MNRDIIARDLPSASIIFTASMSGYVVNQPQPHSAYAVSKAGVHHLARSMAGEWVGHGIRVNSISPGIMNTRLSGGESQKGLRKLWLEKSPLGIGDPEDLTGAVVLLCSEAGRFITGTDVKVDGGSLCVGIGGWALTLVVRRLYDFLSGTASIEEVLYMEVTDSRNGSMNQKTSSQKSAAAPPMPFAKCCFSSSRVFQYITKYPVANKILTTASAIETCHDLDCVLVSQGSLFPQCQCLT